MARCSNCAFDNPAGMRFCGQCGTRLPEPAAPAEPAAGFSPQRFGVMMGADLLERFRRAGLEAAGQRRTVTVLFVDISGYTTLSGQLEAEDLYSLVQPTLGALAQAVYKYDGVVDKFTGDGLMALFGAPIAHEEHAELAVRSALEMQAEVTRLNGDVRQRFGLELQLHIGLHAGPVVVGGVGSDMLMNYTAIGDTVNLARRLEEAAEPGVILVSEAVHQLTKSAVDYAPLASLALKGFAQRQPAFRVVGPKAQPRSARGVEGLHAPLIGRDAEFNRLKKSVTALVTQQLGQFILVTGEGGIGKSRLTSELKALLRPSAVRIIEGYGLTYRRTVSYWAFLDAFRHYLGATPDLTEAQTRTLLQHRVEEVLGAAAPAALPFLENWLSLPPSDPAAAERLRFLDADRLRQQTFLAVRDVLVAEARRQPVWLILEDLHWADDASLELLTFLMESAAQAPLLLYAITRPYGEGALAQLVARAQRTLGERFVEVALTSLSPDQSERLLFQLLPMAEFPERWLASILQRSAGIPYYLEEILRMLIDHGIVQHEAGGWALVPGAEPDALTVPENLQALILARFDRLGPAERHALQAASVIGRQFSRPLLKAVAESLSEAELRAALASLVEREFVMPPDSVAADEYRFKHVLVSDAIYSTLLRRSQSELHGRVGEALEVLYPDQLDKNVELLARHYSFSPRLERALHYLILAGQRAARAYLNPQARQHYEQAVALLSQVDHTLEQTILANMGLGDVLVFAGEYATARVQYQAALDAIPASFTGPQAAARGELYRKLGFAHLRQSDYDAAQAAFQAAQAALAEAAAPSPTEQARILSDLGRTYFERGDLEAAEQALTQGLALVDPAQAPDVVSSLYNRLGAVAYTRGEWAAAAANVRKSVEIRELIGDRVGVAGSLSNLGLLDIALGDLDSAMVHLTRSLELRAQLGDVQGTVIVQGNLGYLYINRGDLDAAADVLRQATQSAQALGIGYLLIQNQRLAGALHVAAQQWDEALAVLEECVQRANEIGAQDQLADVYRLLGEAWLGAGQVEAAREWAQRAVKLMTGTHLLGPTEERGNLLRLSGTVALERHEWTAAEAYLQESYEVFRSLANRLGEGRAHYQLARLAQARGDQAAALQRLRQALEIFQAVGAKLDLAAAQRSLAELGSGPASKTPPR